MDIMFQFAGVDKAHRSRFTPMFVIDALDPSTDQGVCGIKVVHTNGDVGYYFRSDIQPARYEALTGKALT